MTSLRCWDAEARCYIGSHHSNLALAAVLRPPKSSPIGTLMARLRGGTRPRQDPSMMPKQSAAGGAGEPGNIWRLPLAPPRSSPRLFKLLPRPIRPI